MMCNESERIFGRGLARGFANQRATGALELRVLGKCSAAGSALSVALGYVGAGMSTKLEGKSRGCDYGSSAPVWGETWDCTHVGTRVRKTHQNRFT